MENTSVKRMHHILLPVSLLLVMAVPSLTLADAGSGSLESLWHLSKADTTSNEKSQPAKTITAPPLINKKKDQIAATPGNAAEVRVMQAQRNVIRKQQLALTSLNQAKTENETVMARVTEQAKLLPARGWYDAYGVFHPYESTTIVGYNVDEQVLSNGANYIRNVRYVPQVIYVTPYAYRAPCYSPCYRPCYTPCYKPCGYRYRSPLTVRASGDWGFVKYNAGGYWPAS